MLLFFREEREWILKSNIIDLKFWIEPIGSKELHKIVNNEYFSIIRNLYLPAYLGGGTFCLHTSCLLKIGFNEYIILEYGLFYMLNLWNNYLFLFLSKVLSLYLVFI